MSYEGTSLHKEFNMFINKTLAAQKDLNKPTTVYVPGKYLNKKSIDIWGSHAIEIIGYETKTTPDLLCLFISPSGPSARWGTTDEEFKEIIDRTNNILKDIKLKRTIKVYQNRLSKPTKIVKRGYSTLISTLGYTYMNFISTPFRGRFLPTGETSEKIMSLMK